MVNQTLVELNWTLERASDIGRTARDLVADSLCTGVGDDTLADAALLTSELVTNAMMHTADDHVVLSLRFDRTGRRLRVSLTDFSPSLTPVIAAARQVNTVGGFGLRLVGRVADDWGTEAGLRSKTVWFQLEHADR